MLTRTYDIVCSLQDSEVVRHLLSTSDAPATVTPARRPRRLRRHRRTAPAAGRAGTGGLRVTSGVTEAQAGPGPGARAPSHWLHRLRLPAATQAAEPEYRLRAAAP